MKTGCSGMIMAVGLTFCASNARAWGERGHDAVTRVATRIVAQDEDPEIARFGQLLQRKENMLAHLANVPDIVWRNMGPEVDRVNGPSHFIDLEYIIPGAFPTDGKDLPADRKALEKALQKNCERKKAACAPGDSMEAKLQKAGHAPLRIEEMTRKLEASLLAVKQKESPGDKNKDASSEQRAEERAALIDEALLYAGLLSHFVGDLANPHHTAKDYDGWETDQGGLHSYFETEMVDQQSLQLEAQVLDEALRHKPLAARFAKDSGSYLNMAWDLALLSHAELEQIVSLDRKFSLEGKSTQEPRQKAQRKDPAQVNERYRNLLVQRLAAGADALARFWIEAWKQAGKPNVDGYRSFHYPVKPDFIPPSYLK